MEYLLLKQYAHQFVRPKQQFNTNCINDLPEGKTKSSLALSRVQLKYPGLLGEKSCLNNQSSVVLYAIQYFTKHFNNIFRRDSSK